MCRIIIMYNSLIFKHNSISYFYSFCLDYFPYLWIWRAPSLQTNSSLDIYYFSTILCVMYFRNHTLHSAGISMVSYNLISKRFAEIPRSIFVVHSSTLSKRYFTNFIGDTDLQISENIQKIILHKKISKNYFYS